MRIKYSSALLGAALIIAAGCHKQGSESSRGQSQANESFDDAQAMRMLYGNYSVKQQTSSASLPSGFGNESGAISDQEMTVSPIFSAFVASPSGRSFVLLASAILTSDGDFDCHACSPTIGMAVFSQKGPHWTMDAFNRAVTEAGEFGKPPTDINVVQIGPEHHAVEIIDVDEGGETTAVLDILVPWNGTVNLGLERIVADDDKGMCGPGALPCYSNRRTVTFIPSDKKEFYDLELELRGTDLVNTGTAAQMRARKVHGVETLRLENGKYAQVSRRGDLTYLDRDVAQREGLK
jgi:hypothetical protein